MNRRLNPKIRCFSLVILYFIISQGHVFSQTNSHIEVRVKELSDLLSHKEKSTKENAIKALGEIGCEAKSTVPLLIHALKHSSSSMKWNVLRALGEIGDVSAVPIVIAVLENKKKDTFYYEKVCAAEALGNMGREGASQTVPVLMNALRDKDVEIRAAALESLGKLEDKAIPAVPLILGLLKERSFWHSGGTDDEMIIIGPVTEALGRIASKSPSVVSDLISSMKDKNWIVSYVALRALLRALKSDEVLPLLMDAVRDKNVMAVRALGEMGTKALPSVCLLVETSNSKDQTMKFRAVIALARIDPKHTSVITALIEILKDVDTQTWGEPAEILGGMETQAIPPLLNALKDQSPNTRYWALHALGKMKEKAVIGLPHIINLLEDSDDKVREKAVTTLGEIDPKGAVVAPSLIETLKDKNVQIRRKAARVLAGIGQGSYVLPILAEELEDGDYFVRSSAAYSLGNVGPDALYELMNALRSDHYEVKQGAVKGLGKIGIEPTIVVPVLISTLEDRYWVIRLETVEALGNIGSTDAVSSLINILKTDESVSVREAAVDALRKIGSIDAIPALIDALKDQESLVLNNKATSSLKTIGIKGVPYLMKAMQREDEKIKGKILSILGEIGPDSMESLPLLIEALKDESSEIREKAGEAIGKIGHGARGAIPALVQVLEKQSDAGKNKAAESLGKIGPEAAIAIPQLLKCLQDKSYLVRLKAAFSLFRLGEKEKARDVILAGLYLDRNVRYSAKK